MRALVTGGTGFIGRAILGRLERAVVLTRHPEGARASLGGGVTCFAWSPEAGPPPLEAFDGVDAVFHLAGEPVAGGRWTAARKKAILASRVEGTRSLLAALASLPRRPSVLVSASAVGYYGDRGDEILDETAGPGTGWLSEVCVSWEAEAARAERLGIRVVRTRIGIVLGRSGGALKRMLLPFISW